MDEDKPQLQKHSITWKSCLRVGITVLVLFLVVRYWEGFENFLGLFFSGIAALIAGLVIAYILNIPLRRIERRLPGEGGDGTVNRMIALVLSFLLILAIVLFLVLVVVPQLVNALLMLAEEMPAFIDEVTTNPTVMQIVPADILEQVRSVQWATLIDDAISWLRSGVVSSLPQLASILGTIGAWFMGIIFAFWYLTEKNKLSAQCHRIMRNYAGKDVDERLSHALWLLDDCYKRFFVGQGLEALIFGTMVALACALFGLAAAPMLGALVGVMSLIPMVGALVGAFLGALLILPFSWQKALIFLVLFFVVQQIEQNFIYKHVVGKHVGLTGMWPLIGVTFGMALFGFPGVFVGVPLMSAIFRFTGADLDRLEEMPEDERAPLGKLYDSISDR